MIPFSKSRTEMSFKKEMQSVVKLYTQSTNSTTLKYEIKGVTTKLCNEPVKVKCRVMAEQGEAMSMRTLVDGS